MKFFIFLSRALVPTVITCLILVAPVSADDAAREDSPYMLEPVKVTSRKKEEDAQDVPMGMQVLTSDDLDRAGADNVRDAMTMVPNVVFRMNDPENIVVIRGIVTPGTLVNNPVGYYVDDVSQSLPYMHNPELLDVERIEVLKGPQGTLYGHNAEAGVINIITRQPDNEFRAKAFSSYGNYNSFRVGGNVSGPLVEDELYLGLALLQDYTDGYIENIYTGGDDANKEDHLSGRATLRWTPSAPWDISLKVSALDADDKGGLFRYETGPNKTERGEIAYDGANTYEQEHFSQSAQVKYSGQNFNVVAVTTHGDFTSEHLLDADLTPTATTDNRYKYTDEILAQEIRVSSVGEGPWEWLFGLYGHVEETGVYFDFPANAVRDTTYWGVNLAAFSQVGYTLFDSLHLNAGLRYDHLGLTGKQEHTPVGGTMNVYDKGASYDELLPKFSVSYDVNDDVMVYANVARGYLSGGYASAFVTSNLNFMYDPEYNWNYEVGIKSVWLNKKLLANLSAFYIDMEDKQVTEWYPAINSRKIGNASKAYSQGFELELHARPVQGLDLFGGLGYIEARIEDWTSQEKGGGTYTYDGLTLPFVPKFTGNAGVEYNHETGLFGRVDMNFQTAPYADAKNTVKADEFAVYNARLGYDKDGIGVTLWCKNLFDEAYVEKRSLRGTSYLVQDAPPRQFGVTVSYIF